MILEAKGSQRISSASRQPNAEILFPEISTKNDIPTGEGMLGRKIRETVLFVASLPFTTNTNGLHITGRDRRRQDNGLKRLNPQLAGALDTIRSAKRGDPTAKEIVKKAKGAKKLRRRALEFTRLFQNGDGH